MMKIKNCPFCGGEGAVSEHATGCMVRCKECGARIFKDVFTPDMKTPMRGMVLRQAAINAWNTRASGWIPVSERLPEKTGEYLCYGEYGFEVCEFNSLKLFVNFNCDIVQHLVSWQPLPDPYEGE